MSKLIRIPTLLTALLMPMLAFAGHTDDSTEAEDTQYSNHYVQESIKSFYTAQGEAPDDGWISIPEGSEYPDLNDADWNALDSAKYNEWAETNEPENSWWLIELINYWIESSGMEEPFGEEPFGEEPYDLMERNLMEKNLLRNIPNGLLKMNL